jgi:DNA helicase-2/ATP-dependent DNA helicase PcrA
MRNKISYVIWGGVRFFERKEIKDALSYLRLVAFDDDLSFKRIVNVPSRKIGSKSIEQIAKYAHDNGCSLFEALRKLSGTKSFSREPVCKFIELIDTARTLSESMSISNLLEYLLQNSGLNELYRTDEEEERLENLNELIQSVKTYEADHKEDEISLTTYLQEIALYTNLDYTKSKNHVKVMTIHQSKGLEFPYVFISGLSDGIMPNKRSVRERKKSGMEEERRLMYVAATRAEKRLFLTESEGYSVQGGFNKVPSRFIREIREDLFMTEGHMDEDLWNRAAVFSKSMDAECGLVVFEKKGFCEGDEVVHEHFGTGIIRNIYDCGEYCEVEFWESGLRSLKAEKLSKA